MKREFTGRFLFVAGLFALVALLILVQILRIQHSPQAQVFLHRDDQTVTDYQTIMPLRGQVYDRDGHLLAGNRLVYEIDINKKEMVNPNTVAQALSMYLGMDYLSVYSLLTDPMDLRKYLMVANHVPPEIKIALETQQENYAKQEWDERNGERPSLAGMYFIPRYDRSYPEGSLASNVLGYYNWDWRGNFGVEEKYDQLMAGNPILVEVPNDPNLIEEIPAIPEGTSLVLSLDRSLQAAVEDILDQALLDHGASMGVIVVMDPRSGEILAMANSKRLNLNEFWNYGSTYNNVYEYNPAVSLAYEPGSVMKVVTMAAALDAGTVRPDTTVYDSGLLLVPNTGFYVHNWNYTAWGLQDMTGCLQHSINTCLATVSLQMGEDLFYDYMKRFGMGQPTGIDLAGEVPGRLKLRGDDDFSFVELATNAYGQGVEATPVQMLMAVSAVANDGKMVAPHVLHATLDEGQMFPVIPRVAGTPISAETAHTLSEMLAVSLANEVPQALVEGYRLAGKTGTASIPTPTDYEEDVTNTSFIGWGPVDDPQFMVYIWLSRPQSSIWASEVAAPVFAEVVRKTVLLLNIPPDAVRLQMAGR